MEGFKELMQQAHGGDKGARDTLIAGNLGLVHTIIIGLNTGDMRGRIVSDWMYWIDEGG